MIKKSNGGQIMTKSQNAESEHIYSQKTVNVCSNFTDYFQCIGVPFVNTIVL